MANYLIEQWQNISAGDIYQDWFLGPVYGFAEKPGIYDTSPGVQYLKQLLGPPSRMVSIGATNADTGEFVTFNENLTLDDFVEAVICSSALPGIFPYQNFQGQTFIDGGTVMSLNIAGGVQRCREKGFNDSEIVVDVLMCTSGVGWQNASSLSALQMLMRADEISSFWDSVSGLNSSVQMFPEVEFRYAVMPSEMLEDSILPIEFNEEQMMAMIELGKEDAKRVVQMGKGESVRQVLKLNGR